MNDRRELLADLQRVRAKRAATDDRDLRAALDLRIAELETKIAELPEEVAPAPTEEPPLTAEAVRQAESLLKRIHVERSRGDYAQASKLIDEALTVAPRHPFVILAHGEELQRKGRGEEARAKFARARELAPYDDRIEAKYAESVLSGKAAGSVDDQLRAALSDSPFLSPDDRIAGSGAAVLLSALWPGLGHVVLGKTAPGIALMVFWVVLIAWITIMGRDLSALLQFAMGGAARPNLLVLVPLFAALAVWVSVLKSLTAGSGRAVGRKAVSRPAPPVDLPFE